MILNLNIYLINIEVYFLSLKTPNLPLFYIMFMALKKIAHRVEGMSIGPQKSLKFRLQLAS